MQLNLAIIEEELKQQSICVETVLIRDQSLHLSGAALLTRTALGQQLLYVGEVRRLPARWDPAYSLSLVVTGQIDPRYFEDSDTEYLCVREKSFARVFNAVADIFGKYRSFDENLKKQFIYGVIPDEYCNDISRFLGIPMIVFDSSLRLLYCSEDAEGLLNWETDAYSGLRLLPMEFANQLKLVEPGPREEAGVVLLEDDRLPYHVLTTIYGREPYAILAFETVKRLTPWLAAVIDDLRPSVIKAFGQGQRDREDVDGLAPLIRSMLEGKKYSGEDLKNRLLSVGWKPDDDYCCLILKSQMGDRDMTNVNDLCLKVENLFSSCISFTCKGHIAVVINLCRSGCQLFDVSRRIVLLLRDGLMQAGMSFKYWDFETTPIYYCQACQAYEMGKIYRPDMWCYSFADYALYHMLHYGSSMIPPRHLCHPALVSLYDYDKENGTELLKTLETYIKNNCNAAMAANALFIHRNTFYQRLGKIREIERFNLEDSNERLYLQMSINLIGMYHHELAHGFIFPHE